MLGKIPITLFVIFLFNNFPSNSASLEHGSSSSVCDLISTKSVPYSTQSPINVVRKDAIEVRANSPLLLENVVLPPLKVINTGYALEAYGYSFYKNHEKTFGGVLCGQVYYFYQARFYASQDLELSSFTQINGKGSPLTLSITYFNKKYGTFNESLYRRDGLVIENFQLNFTTLDNPLFTPVEIVLNKLLYEPGKYAVLPAGLVYAWFDRLPFLNGYYANYGSYIDLETGKQYECAIYILADRTVYTLSKRQFKNSFLKLKNIEGKPLDNRQPIRETGERKIYKAKGLVGIFLPF